MLNKTLDQARAEAVNAWKNLQSSLVPSGTAGPPSAEVAAMNDAIMSLSTAPMDESREGAIAKYQSHDEWARHFSVVRMTVVPFGITTAIGILAWGWDRGESIFWGHVPLFPTLALIVWFATFLLMGFLTYQTYRQGNEMLKQARAAGINRKDKRKGMAGRLLTDIPAWAVLFASAGLVIAWGVHLGQFNGQSRPTEVRLVKPDDVQELAPGDKPAPIPAADRLTGPACIPPPPPPPRQQPTLPRHRR